jgi:tetratricopeptide (TPR) repeat protein
MNRNDEAADAYRRSIALAPRYADPLNGLGALLVAGGRARESLPYFDAALRLSPDFFEADLNRAIALQVAGNKEDAAAALRRLLARLPSSAAYDRQRAACKTLLQRLSS